MIMGQGHDNFDADDGADAAGDAHDGAYMQPMNILQINTPNQ